MKKTTKKQEPVQDKDYPGDIELKAMRKKVFIDIIALCAVVEINIVGMSIGNDYLNPSIEVNSITNSDLVLINKLLAINDSYSFKVSGQYNRSSNLLISFDFNILPF